MAVTDIRVNPNNKCDLQVRYDGGDWVSVADLSGCAGCGGSGGGAVQYDGVNVTIYNSCSDEFEPSGEPFNPIIKGIYDSLYSPDQSGQCNGAANIARWSKYVADNSLSILATAGVAGAAASFIVGTLANIAGAGFLTESLIASLLSQFVEEGDLFSDASDIDISTELQSILYPYMSDDGTIREPNFTAAVTALYARRDEETPDTAERVRWGHEANIISAVGPYVVSRQNKYAGITDADCSGSGWVEVFDFTTGKHGWNIAHTNGGNWVSGEGWHDQLYIDPDGNNWRGAAIQMAILPTTVTDIKVYYDATLGINTPSVAGEYREIQFMRNGFGEAYIEQEETTEEGGSLFEWTGSLAPTTLVAVSVNVGHDSTDPKSDPGGECVVSKIILSGTGDNPFA